MITVLFGVAWGVFEYWVYQEWKAYTESNQTSVEDDEPGGG
jgi:hypothetical protein